MNGTERAFSLRFYRIELEEKAWDLENQEWRSVHIEMGRGEGTMYKILIVDGYPSIRELLTEELTAEGNMVLPIGHPELIRDLLPLLDPDLIILDLYENGRMQWDFLGEIKKQSPELPVLVFTADYPQGDPRLSLADGWVTKSFLLDPLKRRIYEILAGRAGKGEKITARKGAVAALGKTSIPEKSKTHNPGLPLSQTGING
jgi:DNA-binding response OmpR family regulator